MSSRRLLIVDDDPDVAEGLSELLKLRGFNTDLAGDGKSAILAARARPYAAAIVDVGLPDMDGLDVTLEIRRHQSGVRVFLMTGYRSHEVAARARDAGIHDILVKPFDVSRLARELSTS